MKTTKIKKHISPLDKATFNYSLLVYYDYELKIFDK